MDKYALAFSVSNLGPKRFQKILNEYKDLEKGWSATRQELEKLEIVGKTYETFNNFRQSFNIDFYEQQLEEEKVTFIAFTDKKYPKILKKLENPPIGVYCKGNISLFSEKQLKIGVVGTRKITSYGRAVTESIVSGLVSYEVCIISGLALGVDATAHRAAVEGKGTTIAVLACGVDCCTPSENFSLYRNILDNNGLILSEYPLSQPPNKGTFLARNRLVAALSDGVLITEAAEDSGSLVTAEWGFTLGKKVFAVPGPITSRMSDGSLKLLKKGAVLATDASDVLREFSISNPQFSKKSKMQKFKKLSSEEKSLVSILENEEMGMDELAKRLKVSAVTLSVLLSSLEIRGILKNKNGVVSLQIDTQ